MADSVFRVLPTTKEPSGFFWTSGADGKLRFLQCSACSYLIHPPAPICPQCYGRDIAPVAVSGRGTLHSFTVNHQPWDGVGDVYVIGLVEIEEQRDVRLTTNIVDVDSDDVRIGMPVEVVFEDHEPVFLPLFRPVAVVSAPEQRAVISGIGQSDVGRRLGRDALDLTIDAALAAIDDAGLTVADVDGLAAFPGGVMGDASGFAGPGTPAVQDALRLSLNWHSAGLEGPAQVQAVIKAAMAVSMGLARHVLVYRTVTESTAQGTGRRAGIAIGNEEVGGSLQWSIPFRAYSAANWLAINAQRHFHEFGTTREQLAQIALTARRNASLNPKAFFRDPLSMDDYFAARMITTPFCLFDCDVPIDGSTAVIVSVDDHASAVDHPVARVEAVGTALRGRPSWDQFDDMTTMPARDAAAHMWSRTDLKPSDVDVAELYDGFSWLAMCWIEALGFCGHGESGPFIEGGARIALDGELPLNTNGGQLSAGRLHGYGYIHEAVVQLRGEGGDRQVPGGPEVAVVANGGGPLAGCVLLTRLG